MKIAYLTTCFGTHSHTFIRREIRELRKLGVDLYLFGIHRDPSPAADAADLVADTQYLYPLSVARTIKGNLASFVRSPARYCLGFWQALTREEFSLQRRAKMVYHYFVAAGLVSALREARVTHIHAHFMNVSTSVAMFCAHHAQISFSVTVHSAGEYKTPHILGLKQKLTDAQFLIMISHFNVAHYSSVTPCAHKSTVIRCGMDLDNFADFKAKSQPVTPPLKLLAVGRFVEKKGFKYLLEAVAILKAKGLACSLTIVGDGPMVAKLREMIEHLHLQANVTLPGRKSSAEVYQFMRNADLVIVPSVTSANGEMEGLPVVIMEAMALGTLVVATEHAGIPEIVLPHQTGFLANEKSAASLAEAIISATRAPTHEISMAARKLVESEFAVSIVAQQRLALFQQYCEG